MVDVVPVSAVIKIDFGVVTTNKLDSFNYLFCMWPAVDLQRAGPKSKMERGKERGRRRDVGRLDGSHLPTVWR